MEFLGATEEEQGGGSQTAKANAAAPNAAAAALAATAAATLALSRSPLKPLSLLLASPRAVNFSISYVPDPAAASHFLSLEWVFREGGGGGAAAAEERQRSTTANSSSSSSPSNLPKGNRRAIERGAVWPSALVGPGCQASSNGGRRRRRKRLLSRRLLALLR